MEKIKVDIAELKSVAELRDMEVIRAAVLELEWLRNRVGVQKGIIKKKQNVIDTVNHHNNRLSNDNRATKYALGAKFMEVKKLKDAMIEIQRIVGHQDNISLGGAIQDIDNIVNEILEDIQ